MVGHSYRDWLSEFNITATLLKDLLVADEPIRYGKDTERDDTLLYGKSGRSYVLGANYKF